MIVSPTRTHEPSSGPPTPTTTTIDYGSTTIFQDRSQVTGWLALITRPRSC
ncbi:predicted protein [Botrytis cinerea T4]|uniref:Uncharacterized protein n=1 Tax=Botryotinia fuckeliana (strain T4) TaxID=999810 RepID=G2YRG8_BOTF4|nr:predicted protein [Botrytis cinerea T4]